VEIMGQVIVYPSLPTQIARLSELAYNLWWSWNSPAQALYAEIDPPLWEQVNHNPVRFLRHVDQSRLDRAASDQGYLARYQAAMAAFDVYMRPPAGSTWYAQRYPNLGQRLIAYFSAEFGLHESLPIYSGGLGVLAGDHCKTASDLGLPFVGMGFLYPQGYFRQVIDADGRQQAIYEKLDFAEVPAVPALGSDGQQVVISVDLPGRTVHSNVWRIQVGRIPVYLMDTDVAENAPADRELSARLYGGDQQIRVSQEVMLGIGGVRALRALGLRPAAWHLNEGHAAFLQLERIREYVEEQGLEFQAALWAARGDALFTTHTPVPAGNDAFNFDLMERFFCDYWSRLGLDCDRFLALGRYDYPWGPQFSMTVLALRTTGRANGVSRLHGKVARRMWCSLWPDVPQAEIPIGHVTNGVHTATWLHPGLAELLNRYAGSGWRSAVDDPAMWDAVTRIPDDELWEQHHAAKEQMLTLVRERAVQQLVRLGAGPAEVEAAARRFDPRALTIGFARRFATFKRATLLFRDQERLKRLLNDPARPVQLIFSGKAHPADEPGKAFIQTISQLSRQPGFAGRMVFIEDYDTNIARHLVSGVDVWLNNPRRPLEASGTSGQKAGLNGVPNLSVLDGWWAEGYDGQNGWAIGAERDYPTEAAQDEADVLSLYAILENEIVPSFYSREADGIPHGWLARMRASMASVGPAFSTARMLKEYVTGYYGPYAGLGEKLGQDDFAGARALAGWEAKVRAAWPRVSLAAVGPTRTEASVGQAALVTARLNAGSLTPADLAVEWVCARQQSDDLANATILPMKLVGSEGTEYHYEAVCPFRESGSLVYGVRVRPNHPYLPGPFALGLVRWARP
jgi:starch phosphorylase